MVIKANPFKSVILIVLAVVLIASILIACFVPRVSANTNAEAVDVVDTQPIETFPVVEEETVSDEVQETEPPVVEETIPQETVKQEPESNTEKPNKTNDKECGCAHVWKDEYTPETETTSGSLIRECLKCGETKLLETFPPLTKE